MLRDCDSKGTASHQRARRKRSILREKGSNEALNSHGLRGWFAAEIMSEVGAAVEEMDVFHISYNKAQGRAF